MRHRNEATLPFRTIIYWLCVCMRLSFQQFVAVNNRHQTSNRLEISE
jgi:hypothetical protein